MALRGASTTVDQDVDSDWIDWAALAGENAAVLCSVLDIEDEKDFGNGAVAPVIARVIVLTGSKAGTVYEKERILKKGIRMKLTTVGDDVVGRLVIYGTRKAVGLNAEHEGDIELAERAIKKFGSPNAEKSTKAKAEKEDDTDPPF